MRFFGLAVVCALAAADTPPAPVIVTVQSKGRVRVQVSEGITMPCDSIDNHMLFNTTLSADESFQTQIATNCVCVRNTTDSFPQGEWTTSKLACRPRSCPTGKRCYPTKDPTIRVTLTARAD